MDIVMPTGVYRWHIATETAKQRRLALIERMGGKCQRCQRRPRKLSKLEFHHLQERTWIARSVSPLRRIILYEQEFSRGLVELRCSTCNKLEGKPNGQPDF